MKKKKVLKPCSLLISLILILFLPSKALSIPPPTEGDWIITGEEIVENETITLNGNLIVKGDGSLTLRNVTLVLNNTYAGQYHISAETESTLAIYESRIHPSNLEYGFSISVEGASFVMKEGEVRGLGYRLPDGVPCMALTLRDLQGAVVHGNVIEHTDSAAFYLQRVTDSEISDNTVTAFVGEEILIISPTGFGIDNSHDNIIVNNVITAAGNYTGMYFSQSTGNYVANNDLWSGPTGAHLGHGICLEYDSNNNVFEGNTIHGPTG